MHGAIKRSLEFTLTKEEAYQIYLDQNGKCKYTGLDIPFNSSTTKTDGTASLDRINNSKGYTKDNVQWVHKKINQIKMDLNELDFVYLCHLVSENTNKPDSFNENSFSNKDKKYYNKRDNCLCGNLKLKTAKKCKECFLT